jgi:hypothetical protein
VIEQNGLDEQLNAYERATLKLAETKLNELKGAADEREKKARKIIFGSWADRDGKDQAP